VYATIRFYAQLNDFLPHAKRQRPIEYHFNQAPAIKDVIESLGVPHPEVHLILVNGISVGFKYLLQAEDYVSVYPPFQMVDISDLSHVYPPTLQEIRFVLDVHLGQLARYLRLLGFDTLYRRDYRDPELADISSRDNRILLTRDRGLLKRSVVTYGYCLRTTHSRQQLIEVLRRFKLTPSPEASFQRCIRCNGLLNRVRKEAITHLIHPQTRQCFNQFHQCQSCNRVYWRGSHYERMQKFVTTLSAELDTDSVR
jgi:uncharacterized protein with PIN domain